VFDLRGRGKGPVGHSRKSRQREAGLAIQCSPHVRAVRGADQDPQAIGEVTLCQFAWCEDVGRSVPEHACRCAKRAANNGEPERISAARYAISKPYRVRHSRRRGRSATRVSVVSTSNAPAAR
jgi:hypothetical protein